jgi:hypothetical protein
MLTFLLAVEAKSGEKLEFDPDSPPVAGYYQTLGVTACSEAELRDLIVRHLRSDSGGELLGIEERWIPDFAGSDHEILELSGDIAEPGVWYASGRAFFGQASDED